MKRRNEAVVVTKLLFCICIIIMHYSLPFLHYSYFLEGAYIFVEFFFILQGYYLYEKINVDGIALDNTILYIKDRILRFLPCVAVEVLFWIIKVFEGLPNFMRVFREGFLDFQ